MDLSSLSKDELMERVDSLQRRCAELEARLRNGRDAPAAGEDPDTVGRFAFFHAEKRLRESESLIRSVGYHLQNGMLYQIIRDNNGVRRFTYVSEAVRRLYGCSPEEAMADANLIYGRVLEEDRERVIREEEASFSAFSEFHTEARVRNPSGSVRWSYFASSPRRLDDGSTCWDGLEIDITDRRRAVEELRESETRFRMLTESSLIGVYIYQDGRFKYVNPALAQMVGYSEDELTRMEAIELTHPEDRAIASQMIRRRIEGELEVARYNCRLLRKTGAVIEVEALGRRFTYEGRPAVMGTLQDITERRRAEEAIKSMNETLERRVEERTRQLQSIIHELRKEVDERMRVEEALRESEKTARALLDATSDIAFMMAPDGYVLVANHALAARFGRTPAEMAGVYPHELLPRELAESRGRQINEVSISKAAVEFEDESQGRWFNNRVYPVLNDQGQVTRLACFARDITDRKRMDVQNEALRQMATRIAASADVNNMIDAVQQGTTQLFSWDAHYFAVRRPEDDRFRILRFVDMVDGERRVFATESRQPLHLSRSLHAVLAGEPVLVNREPGNPEPLLNRFGNEDRPSASLMYAPVRSGNAIIGIISVQSYTCPQYNKADLQLLQQVADFVAPAIERAFAEEALRESETRFKLAMDAAEEGLWDRHFLSGRVYRNEQFYRMLGYEPDEIPESFEGWTDFIHPEDRERASRSANAIREPGSGTYAAEYRFRSKNGEWRWLHSRGRVVEWDALGRPVRATGTHIDVTERKRAEEALRISEETFSRAFLASPAPISITRLRDTRLVAVNEAYENLIGYPRDELIGHTTVDLGLWIDLDTRHQALERLNADGRVGDLEIQLRRKDGAVITCLYAGQVIQLQGEPCILATLIDTTARREAELLAQQRQAELAHALRLSTMGEMASGLAHELNQPLGAVCGYADACRRLLREGKLQDVEAIVGKISAQTRRATEIIRRIHGFIRKEPPLLSSVDINGLVRETMLMVEMEAKVAKAKVVLDLANQLPRPMCDAIQLQQVILNLAINGLDAIRLAAGGSRQLMVETRFDAQGGILIAVHDTGQGLPEEVKARLFEPFFTTKPGGTGLGLPISKSIVAALGGQVWAESRASGGASFFVSIPCDAA